jgi:hypothetical protein
MSEKVISRHRFPLYIGEPAGFSHAFFAALTFTHRARCAAAIFLLATADIVRFLGIVAAFASCPPFPFALFHRAF